jgi:hypothetical protein
MFKCWGNISWKIAMYCLCALHLRSKHNSGGGSLEVKITCYTVTNVSFFCWRVTYRSNWIFVFSIICLCFVMYTLVSCKYTLFKYVIECHWGSVVSIVSWLQTGRLGFDPWQKQRISSLASVSRPVLRPT